MQPLRERLDDPIDAPPRDAGVVSLEVALDQDDRPRWDQISLDVLCSRCGYNLRGLVEPRCPECGLQFRWRDLLDGLGRTTTWLFEHNWTTQPLRSWMLTVAAEMRGRAFWRELSIHHFITAGPLLVMMLAAPLMAVFVSITLAFTLSEALPFVAGFTPADHMRGVNLARATLIEVSALCGQYCTFAMSLNGELFALPASVTFAYGMLAVVLCCYRQTLARRRLRTIQVLRVVAHAAFPTGVAVGLLPILTMFFGTCVESIAPTYGFIVPLSLLVAIPAMVGVIVGRGLRQYLGIGSGVPTVAVSTVLVMLLYPFVCAHVFIVLH